ncbi:DNA cytosine methyltransferase [Oceanicella actignis]|uniref:DNA cytosine methyltransferase n=1 Tax=Oceanicella actignis TaxID=1189325 RepID=UPI0011E82083|nr:DNA cytosine methyltransferase [Oceanicella actignis]TYO89982.1 DNA (cytosine-5)-methyltransferase 1 [Oceanicella actignis]
MARRAFYEFFAGGGMARIGLGAGWRCLMANDNDPVKCAAYRENFGDAHLIERPVAELCAADLPGRADLAWASFPCQDLSLAGLRRGMSAARSGAFWGFWFLIEQLLREGRAPRALMIENVVGLASSNDAADLAALTGALAQAGYSYDAHVVDAAGFVPQSRPRLFIFAWLGPTPAHMIDPAPVRPMPLFRGLIRIGPDSDRAFVPLRLAPPPGRRADLGDLLEERPADQRWRSAAQTRALLALMTPRHRARVEEARARARAEGRRVAGGVYRRTRPDGKGGTVQRAEVRFDVAGCLRTPAGGSSRQTVLACEPDGRLRSRLLSAREAARLMGLPDDYRLPPTYTNAYKLAGDGVVPPVVRHLAAHLIEPLLDAQDAAGAAPQGRPRAATVVTGAGAP